MPTPDRLRPRPHALIVPGLGDHLESVRKAHTRAAELINADVIPGQPRLSTVVFPSLLEGGATVTERVGGVATMIRTLAETSQAPVRVVGARLGGNIALLAAGEVAKKDPDAIGSVVAIQPRTRWSREGTERAGLAAMSGLAVASVDLLSRNWVGGEGYANVLDGKVAIIPVSDEHISSGAMTLEGVPAVVAGPWTDATSQSIETLLRDPDGIREIVKLLHNPQEVAAAA